MGTPERRRIHDPFPHQPALPLHTLRLAPIAAHRARDGVDVLRCLWTEVPRVLRLGSPPAAAGGARSEFYKRLVAADELHLGLAVAATEDDPVAAQARLLAETALRRPEPLSDEELERTIDQLLAIDPSANQNRGSPV